MKLRRNKRTGMSLVETIVASTMTVTVMFGAVLALLTGTESWARGEGQIGANMSAQNAIRTISTELRQALEVTNLADVTTGEGTIQRISYKLPTRLADGTFVTPATWDGVTRRIEFVLPEDATTGFIRMVSVEGGETETRTLARGVSPFNPLAEESGTTYRVFDPNDDEVIRWVVVTIATDHAAAGEERATTRVSETIYLRNIPVTAS